jgi:SAM-dependent methyltransferase
VSEKEDWGRRAQRGFLGSGIDPGDRRGYKNHYIDLLQKAALEEVLELKGDEIVLDFGCGSGRISYWIAPRVKRVIGLEVTPEMIDLAERNRTSENVEFVLYDGFQPPVLSHPVDIVLSVGVLQTMRGGPLRQIVSHLARYLKPGGKMALIEQASDNPKVGRLEAGEYQKAFEEATLECLQSYPIRKGRWWLLYFIRYGLIPRSFFREIAKHEMQRLRIERELISYYRDYLFLLRKPSLGKE